MNFIDKDNLWFEVIECFLKYFAIFLYIKNCSLLNKSYLNKEIDLDEDKMTISAGFTQEETLKFSMPLVKAQLKILLVDGTVCASPIFDVSVDDILNPKLMENTEVGD